MMWRMPSIKTRLKERKRAMYSFLSPVRSCQHPLGKAEEGWKQGTELSTHKNNRPKTGMRAIAGRIGCQSLQQGKKQMQIGTPAPKWDH
jgi:hypothetical protein